ncbi:MAG: ABC transporter substrate-binding protein [Methylococcales bacterium]|nr:ABC transporter substrate-binding protein [Methylococcales bacterium]
MFSVSCKRWLLLIHCLLLSSCNDAMLNNPYPAKEDKQSILYSSFSERPKHLDPAVSYSSNEYAIIGQIYEPLLQYHYLKRPYQLVPLTAAKMPEITYLIEDQSGVLIKTHLEPEKVRFTDYMIEIKPGIRFQPHPALAKGKDYIYHNLQVEDVIDISTITDFEHSGTREVVAEDYVHQIKRLVHPKIHSPIAELMKEYIVGLEEFSKMAEIQDPVAFRGLNISGVEVIDKFHFRIRIYGKYPQFIFWLSMPFFSPMPWEADVFYGQDGLADKNISLDWFPIGSGAYMLSENNPNRQMVLSKNPYFHLERYPNSGEPGDFESGLLADAGKSLPFIDKVIYVLEKETIPYWNKFLQGYYDASGVASDSFDQAIQFMGDGKAALTPALQKKEIRLQTAVTTSISYLGFNMIDGVVGGRSDKARKLRQAISIIIDYEEYIAIFMNGRGVPAQGLLPPGIFGYESGVQGLNPYVYDWHDGYHRKSMDTAKRLLSEAGFKGGVDPSTQEALVLYLDTAASGPDDRARLNWYRKQFSKIGLQLVIRATDYNRFQQKIRSGNAQLFLWGWNADYPDPENFLFLLYGPHSKIKTGGENAANYQNAVYDRLFEEMRNLANGPVRLEKIHQLQEIIRYDAPWVLGFYPKSYSLIHKWYQNLKPNLMANNKLKYTRIDSDYRARQRQLWNKPLWWPMVLLIGVGAILLWPALVIYRRRKKAVINAR